MTARRAYTAKEYIQIYTYNGVDRRIITVG